tara:strand:+ start:252 stop:728 length:477 start_codon:yes stop_codon:yes gene_type:complete
MVQKKSNTQKYRSISTKQPCSAAQYCAELVCIRKRERENKGSLEFKFWNKSQKEEYETQIRLASKLIKKYGEKSLVSYLNSPNGRNVYSLGFLHKSKKFVLITKFVEKGVAERQEQIKIEDSKPKKIIEIAEDTEYKPKKKNKKKTLLSKLRDTDGKK